ncbi:MAG TPA: hypothetical protein VNT99_10660 [Methylomirabilota bacterium]|nr:hypothetical protein [Methylomirabilota bacterium]
MATNNEPSKNGVLRHTSRKAIIDLLSQSHFGVHAFEVKFDGLRNADDVAQVVFAPNRHYTFLLRKSKAQGSRFQSYECPGEELSEQTAYSRHDMDMSLRALTAWIGRILEDYRQASPFYDEFSEFRSKLMDELSKHAADPTIHFTQDEVRAMQERLDALGQRFDQLQQRNEITEAQLANVKQQLEAMKTDLNVFPKQTWYKTAGNKLVDIVFKYFGSEEGQKVITSTAKALLPGPPAAP